jgi:hypothetical protein
LLTQHAGGALAFLFALCLTDGALALLSSLDPQAAHWLEVTVLAVASVLATVVRYLALRS